MKSSSQLNKMTNTNESRASTPNRDVNNNNREDASSNTSRTRTNQRPSTNGCFNCGQQGHLARDCLVGRQQMNMEASSTQMGTQIEMGQQQQQSIYSSGINLNNGPAMNNVTPSAPPATTNTFNTDE